MQQFLVLLQYSGSTCLVALSISLPVQWIDARLYEYCGFYWLIAEKASFYGA